jgi:hypothetical protein
MVAVKPGSIPTMIPRKVAQKTENRIAGVINPQSAFTKSTTPNESLLFCFAQLSYLSQTKELYRKATNHLFKIKSLAIQVWDENFEFSGLILSSTIVYS